MIRVILLDLLLTAAILGVYALFQLLLPMLRSGAARPPAPTPAAVTTNVEETTPPAEETAAPASPAVAAELKPEPTPDTRSPWQIQFAEHFTDEVVVTDHSYTSPRVSITLSTESRQVSHGTAVCHVADIYVADIEHFKTATANDELRYFSTQDVMEIDAAAHAILAISGDFYSYQPTGFLMRNGEIYRQDQTGCDICVLYADGELATYEKGSFDIQTILDRQPLQVWNFGPALLDAEGHVKPHYQVSTAVSYPNPRSAVGYFEPGHYCFVVVDGRQAGYSDGMLIPELAQLFEDLGCTAAYNLDGGGSAVMTFLHEKYSRQSNGGDRALSDILLITEPGFDEQEAAG